MNELGINALELFPPADSKARFEWGHGVFLPYHDILPNAFHTMVLSSQNSDFLWYRRFFLHWEQLANHSNSHSALQITSHLITMLVVPNTLPLQISSSSWKNAMRNALDYSVT